MLKSPITKLKAQYNFYRKSKAILNHVGNDVECSICESTFNIFATFGLGRRKNARCLQCDSLERHRLIWLYLNGRTNLFSEQRKSLLHFAPEEVFHSKFSALDSVDYFPCDLFPEKYEYPTGKTLAKIDITSIPFQDDHFDVILCNHVLEHIPDDRLAMRELYRVMKPSGWCILQVPIDYSRVSTYEDFSITSPLARKKAFGKTDHVRWYGQDYPKRLQEAGFNVQHDMFVDSSTDSEKFRYGLMPGEMIYYCTK